MSTSSNQPTSDVDFLHAWDGFYYSYCHLKQIGWEQGRILPYLKEVKRSVLEGRFSFSSLPELEQDRDARADVLAVLERENKTVTFDQLKILKK